MMFPDDKDSVFFAHPYAEELFGYLYSFILFRRQIDIQRLDASMLGAVSVHVQAEMDVWMASTDRHFLQPNHPSFKYRFSQIIDGLRWHVQPTGAKLLNIRFCSQYLGSESVYAEIDLGNNAQDKPPKVLSIFPGSQELDFVVSRNVEKQSLRMLYVSSTGRRALLFPKSKQTDNWEVMPLDALSLSTKLEDPAQGYSYKTISLRKFLPTIK